MECSQDFCVAGKRSSFHGQESLRVINYAEKGDTTPSLICMIVRLSFSIAQIEI